MADKKAKEEKAQLLGTKDVADKLKIDSKYLRTILRSLDKYNDSGHTRYEWKKDDPFLDKLPGIVQKYREEHERTAKEKAEKKTSAKPKAVAKKKAAAKKSAKPKPAEPPAAEVTDAIEEVA